MPLEKLFPHPQSFIVEFVDGEKVPVDSKECCCNYGTKAETIARQAIYKANKRVPYKDRDKLFPVRILNLEIDGGKLKTTLFQTFQTKYSHDDMTEDEFGKEMSDILSELPSPFRGFISSEAWERGHSSGHQEVVTIANELANKLLPYINDYKEYLLED